MLVPFVPLHAALADVFCNIPRVLVLTLIVIMTICGMLFIPEDQFTATYVGGSNDGIASTPTFSACVHYCEKTYLDPSGFGRESIGGEGICGVNGSKVKFCLFRSEEPSNCTRVTTNDITDEMMDELGHSVKCSFKYKVTNWHPYFVIGGLAIAITLVIQGLEPEVALLGAVAIFAAAGVVTVKQATAGFASSSVIALALLLPVAKAMEETGLLDRAVSVMLGQPDSFPVALVRMMVPVALLSACLSNTAIVAMLVPVIISWSRRLGCHPGKLMMPLSFAAQLGGSMTLIGSSHCLVARESVREVYEVNFFSTTPAATWLLLVTTIPEGVLLVLALVGGRDSGLGRVAILVLAPTRLLRHSADPASEGCCDGSAPGAEQSDLLYSTVFVVQQHGALEGAEVDCVLCTLKKLPGVASVSLEEERRGARPSCTAGRSCAARRPRRASWPCARSGASSPGRSRSCRCSASAARRALAVRVLGGGPLAPPG
ncbi:unnamed protein product [Prorocentrum cordatum]|uniref:Citrate transporter-like domain-containing protein n=1 Tax=Prorocentrum cordatum TaxID=2364126 RepID=A0ABN9RPY0_9DINO|nr:unnamed protein product [Polarella glacialis]